MRRDLDAEASKRGEGCPLTIRLASEERPELPQRGRKWILCIYQIKKKPSGTPFSVFLSDGKAPQTSLGPGKLSPSPMLLRRRRYINC